ncbi:preprotein translocase subunit SecE [Marinigracilibium pacificum]|uniref:Protein translocase subunit SecE n=1 Tax=Marinigracilibium pacificum TaxID=2729599 RepID=A0A848J293_9BACT|nr:preprotein translocase subunit SecE [Marinigracilibium pacificum]NMM49448.1 preprotein translocase subunit SecE [Marinigracilibium pacificum]
MNKLVSYIKESYIEMTTKVSWPGYRELQNNAVLVLIASLIFALVIGLIDSGFQNLTDFYYNNIK